MKFLGRKNEIERLRATNWRGGAELVVVYGRRRVGKTALVEEAFKDARLWRFDALEGQKLSAQLAHFHSRLLEVANVPPKNTRGFASWEEALSALCIAVGQQPAEPLVVFWDEFQWAAEMRSYLVSLFKSFWDRELSKRSQLKLVLCGSISSFMVKRVIRSKALYGRVDTEIHLKALPLSEIKTLCATGQLQNDTDLIDIALSFGGVPAYLRQLNPSWSFRQNIDRQAFDPSGYFYGEFDRVFVSHFGANPTYRRVIEDLQAGVRTADQLARATGHETGGGFKTLLEELALAGFIERYTPLDKSDNSKLVRYRILDEYLHFYTRFIAPHRREIEDGQFSALQGLAGPVFDQWRGYAFERLCRKHQRLIADTLKFSGVRYRFGTWFKRALPDLPGAQIDLLFVRADRVITLCEAKAGMSIDATKLAQAIEVKRTVLQTQFPKSPIQTVLLVPVADQVPQRARSVVHEVVGLLDAS